MNVPAAWDACWARPILRSRLTALRVAFFGLLGLDLWLLMVPHAPRHADGFNVSHVPALDGLLPEPSVTWFTALYLFAGFLSFRVALGLASRASVVLLAVVYNVTYFWSQLDSYQHHYLMCLLTLLACFVPWHTLPGLERPRDDDAPTHVVSWAARLMYVQVSIVYFFTATTMVTDRWLDGWALNEIIHVEWVREFYAQVNQSMGWSDLGMYALVAHAIMLWQFLVAFAFLTPKLRPLACVTGPVFHILVEVIDLKIGWFSYYMIAIYYLLLFPDAWFLAIGRPIARAFGRVRVLFDRIVAVREPAIPFHAVGGAVLVGAATAMVPVEGRGLLMALVVPTALWALWPSKGEQAFNSVTHAIAHGAIGLLMVGSLHISDAPYDYYRFWAGDLARRGELTEAARRYERANELRRGEKARHFQLAQVYERLGRPRDAEREYVRGLQYEPASRRGTEGLRRVRQ